MIDNVRHSFNGYVCFESNIFHGYVFVCHVASFSIGAEGEATAAAYADLNEDDRSPGGS